MTKDEAIKTLREDYCGNRIICELYPDQCNQEECEIWLAIRALETQPDGDCISRAAAIDTIKDADVCVCYSENESVEIENAIELAIRATKRSVIASIEQMSSAQPEFGTCETCDCQKSCKHAQYLGNDGYCSRWKRRTDGSD